MSQQKNPAAVSLSRSIPTSPKALFEAWTQPELVQRWGPERASIEAKLGGQFRFETDGVAGTFDVHLVRGEYKEFVPEKRIVQSWIYSGPLSLDEEVETTVTVEFKDKGKGLAEISIREEGTSLSEPEARQAAREAWEAALDNLSIVCIKK